jgi:hypothetical protein
MKLDRNGKKGYFSYDDSAATYNGIIYAVQVKYTSQLTRALSTQPRY